MSFIYNSTLRLGSGTDGSTKTDEFLEKFQGVVIFNPKIYIADFGPLYRSLNRDFRKNAI